MLELKNVSKFYYNKGIVSSGFSKVSLKFELGEFIAITGESGSGKSTLLNVISGLDSYEEGEMYIFGNETSHYTEKDYEVYRKKYIGNIFQNFNLVNSYTVYQNVELILLINGYKKKEIKTKINDILKKVDMYKYRNKKVSKLSGGQKQRVAIARALAQNTPIILADEPTGNLDKKSSESVLKLLHEISHDKLVIIVTHNYDQIEEYVTRKITMHDGRVLEDKKIKSHEKVETVNETKSSNIRFFNKILLGIRNAFNIPAKFLLTTFVYLFIVFSLFTSYSSFTIDEYESSINGINQYFTTDTDKRIIIKKYDKTPFSDEDYKNIENLNNVEKIVKNDLLIDENLSINDGGDFYLYGKIYNVNELKSVDEGRLPENDNEIVIALERYYLEYNDIVGKTMVFDELSASSKKYNVVVSGVIATDSYETKIYAPDKVQNDIANYINKNNTRLKYKFYDIEAESYFNSNYGEILPSDKVQSGKVVIPEEWSYKCKNLKCKNKNVKLTVSNIYFNFSKDFKVTESYTKKTFNKLTGYKYDNNNGSIFINTNDYNSLFERGIFQSSVFIKDEKLAKDTIKELEDMGIKTLYLPDITFPLSEEFTKVLKIIKVVFISGLIIGLFFISYFIIKLILKSRNIYYSTLRILGASGKTTKDLLLIELLVTSHVSYLIFVIFILLNKFSIINSSYLKEMISYVTVSNYILIYVILMIMTILIAARYSRKLFKGSVMNSYREEV